MKQFQIIFYDNSMNELFVKWTHQFDYNDAEKYAKEIVATTTWNDVSSFLINQI
jgi:hypothetical protein